MTLAAGAVLVGCSGDAALSRGAGEGVSPVGAGGGSTGTGGSAVTGSGGTGMGSTGGAAGRASTAGDAGGGAIGPSVWHGAKSAQATDAMLQQEYATWKMRNVQMCAGGSAVVKRDAGSVVSEGIGYGMLLSAAFSDRTLFDGLFRYYNDHLDDNGLMNWAAGLPN